MATALALGRAAARTTRRRLPLTATLTLAVLVLGAVSGALWTPLADGPLRETVGYGLPAWRAGHWWSIVTGAFFADRPVAYLPLLLGLVLVGGVAEWRLGTRRVLVAGVVTHVAGVGGAVVVVVATAGRGWDWSTALATRTDLGMTSAVLGTAAAVSATCSPTWRLRLRAVVVGYAAFALLLVGALADLERLLAVAAGLAVGPALASAGHPSRYASRASRRLVIAIVLAIVASLHLALAAERCPLIFAGTGSAPERAATTTFLHDGSAVLVPLLLVIAAVCVWHGGRRAGWGAVGIMALVTLAHLAPLRWLAAHHTLWWPLAVFAAVDLALLAAVTFLVLP
ncbi:MAG: hypothetical protein ABJA74_16675, partial [Lapillicoccus sp.]